MSLIRIELALLTAETLFWLALGFKVLVLDKRAEAKRFKAWRVEMYGADFASRMELIYQEQPC